ncbi:unnamed protein product [Prunus armeniaca]
MEEGSPGVLFKSSRLTKKVRASEDRVPEYGMEDASDHTPMQNSGFVDGPVMEGRSGFGSMSSRDKLMDTVNLAKNVGIDMSSLEANYDDLNDEMNVVVARGERGPSIQFSKRAMDRLWQYLVMHKWRPEFCPATAKITRITAWIRVSALQLECFDVRSLKRIGNLLGKLLKIDSLTTSQNRGRLETSHTTYNGLIDRVTNRLASWKSKLLSIAGRATLVQAVTSSIPIYAMQTVKLPASVCEHLDRLNRNFFWGGKEEKNKVHLCQRDLVCRPKCKEGIGFKKTAAMNQALLSKIGWRVQNKDNGLWAKIFKAKYLNGAFILDSPNSAKKSSSHAWKGIVHGVELLLKGMRWRIGLGDQHASSNGVFSVKTAYKLFFVGPSWPESSWAFLWKLKIPPKLQTFFWLASQSKILSNEYRVRRQLAIDSSCGLCDWPDFIHWLKVNLLSKAKWGGGLPWSVVFVFTCWYLWKWRNKHIFLPLDESVVDPVKTPNGCERLGQGFSGMFKLNVDGSRRAASACIGAGGVIRGANGNWICGFAVNLGKGQILEAELWGLYFGLHLACDKGISNLLVEMDVVVVVSLVQQAGTLSCHPFVVLIQSCCALMRRIGNCHLAHVYREMNVVAVRIANWSFNLDFWMRPLLGLALFWRMIF